MKELRFLPKILTMLCLTTILISSSAFTKDLTTGPSLDVGELELTPPVPLDIQLPLPIEIKQNDTILYAWDTDGYGIILEIFSGYTMWADNYIAEAENDTLWEVRLEICKKDAELEAKNLHLAIDHRDRMYELWYEHEKDYDKGIRRQKLKAVLVSTGVGVVGVAAGIITGFLLAR